RDRRFSADKKERRSPLLTSYILSSAAEFILLSASARTRIVSSDLLALDDRAGFLLLQIQSFSLLLSEDIVPHRKLVQPVRSRVYHVLVQQLFVKAQIYVCILVHLFDRVLHLQAVIDSIQESDHGQDIHIIF